MNSRAEIAARPYVVAGLDYLCNLEQKEEIMLRGKCHPEAGVRATYRRLSGTLELCCVKCDKFVANIAVASSH